ncbi:acyl-CoA dehydrogenase family protein [Mycolicibacterium vinylchloridicum]|uniref:acyl-CoA dehydrogenase family protein n=1 Tax=Mycolicibacterium vinylchloridicum TaxID=2736928 RepID=UPI0015C9C12B|nr:acyl-CoA dehydrogenase family protein [Mycolicibacterium vinylchloridicum]
MDLALSDEQRQLVESFAGLFERESTTERVRAAESTGFDPKLWAALMESGVLHMAIDEESGGWGASCLDLALVAEQFGRAVASAPLVEAQVAAVLLQACAAQGNDAAATTLASALEGELLVTLAPRPSVANRLGLVPGGSVADAVVALDDDRLILVRLGDNRTPVSNLGSMPLADVEIGPDRVLLAAAPAAGGLFDAAIDIWMTLQATALVGAAARALEITVDYAIQRKAFGVPIGSFQAVSHRLADSATAIDGARLLGYRAACAGVDEPDRASELAAMAFSFAYESARDLTHRGIHFHGGYGFMMEQDIQLFYRRCRGWANVFGDTNTGLDRVANARYGEN